MPWYEAIDQPGAGQMQYGRRLIESRPFLTRDPRRFGDRACRPPEFRPRRRPETFVATRDSEGSYAMVYVPAGRPFKVRMDKITGGKVKAWWYNPRNGKATLIGEFTNTGETRIQAAGAGARISTGCWCSTTLRRISRRPGPSGGDSRGQRGVIKSGTCISSPSVSEGSSEQVVTDQPSLTLGLLTRGVGGGPL